MNIATHSPTVKRLSLINTLLVLSVAMCAAYAEELILSCRDSAGNVIFTDADECPNRSKLEKQHRIELPQSSSSRASTSSAQKNRNSSRVVLAQEAACSDLFSRKHTMMEGLDAARNEADTAYFQERLRRIEADQCRLSCLSC